MNVIELADELENLIKKSHCPIAADRMLLVAYLLNPNKKNEQRVRDTISRLSK